MERSTESSLNWDEIVECMRKCVSETDEFSRLLHKPKVPSDKKLARIAGKQQFKDVILPTMVHYIRRYLIWREEPSAIKPMDELERSMFGVLSRALEEDPAVDLDILQMIVNRYDTIKDKHKKRLFHKDYIDLGVEGGIHPETLVEDFSLELIKAADQWGLIKWVCPPGKVRQETISDQLGEFQVKLAPEVNIWEINGLRGADIKPSLKPSSYTSDEIEKECKYEIVKKGDTEVIKPTCTTKQYNPPGSVCEGEHVGNVCLRVPVIAVGEFVKLVGVNFFNDQCLVKLSLKKDPNVQATFKCDVCGDMKAPLQEIVGGKSKLIDDSCVRDLITFYVDSDTWTSKKMPAGIYDLVVLVPNSIDWTSPYTKQKPQFFYSKPRPVRVLPMFGDYKVWIDELYCEEETDGPGSDEVGVIVWGAEYDKKGTVHTWEEREDALNNSALDNVDTGDVLGLSLYLVGSLQDYQRVGTDKLAYSIAITGYEIDSEDVYKDQVKGAWEVFKKMWNETAWPFGVAGGGVTVAKLAGWLSSLGAGIAGAVTVAIEFVLSLFLSWWAPPDLIMKDTLNLNPSTLDFLTHPSTQIPIDYKYDMDSIHVHVVPQSKKEVPPTKKEAGYIEYIEKRRYRCDDEDSTYWLKIRYRRETTPKLV
jgi:hypothetical protein